MQDSKKGFLPMLYGITVSKKQCPSKPDEQERMRAIPYDSTIGSVMCFMLCTRPDVSDALSSTSRYQSNYGDTHCIIVKNILKYLRRTKEAFLVFGGEEELVVKGYSDARFQTDADDSKSQSGFVFCLNGGAVSWKNSKQGTVADLTMEAEYIPAYEAAKVAVWIKKFVFELGFIPSASNPMDLSCDNSGAIRQAKEGRAQKGHYHLIHEIIGRGDMKVYMVHTDHNVVDPLTKPLPQPKHETHMRSLGIRYLHE
jgi:hypothetical protein